MSPNILDSIPDLAEYKTFTERYFTKRYILDVDGVKNNDIMIMFHSNRIALLCLAPSHFFLTNSEKKYNINFSVGSVDRLTNVVKGKGKKGGQYLLPKSVVCKVEYGDGNSFDIPAGLTGKLIEVNENLVKEPELLKSQPDSDGFVAIILASITNSEAAKSQLMTQEEYEKIRQCSN